MGIDEAIRLLHPDTTADAIAKIEYYGGFNGRDAATKAIEDACLTACSVMEMNSHRPCVSCYRIDGEMHCERGVFHGLYDDKALIEVDDGSIRKVDAASIVFTDHGAGHYEKLVGDPIINAKMRDNGEPTISVDKNDSVEHAESVNESDGVQEIKVKYFAPITKLSKIDVGDWIDLRAAADVYIPKSESCMIPLGVAMQLPKGYEAHIVPRSSTFKRFGIIQLNHMGVIDESYCGDYDQWYFPAYAFEDTTIHFNERICQFRIIKKQPRIRFTEVVELGNANRGGFGSTGVE